MVPSVPAVLNGLARAMLMDLLPQNKHAYGGQTLQLGAALAMMCAQEFDRAAARLSEENTALLALFGDAAAQIDDAAAQIDDAALRDELRAAVTAQPPGLLVSVLLERNRTLRGLLVRLHAHVELLETPTARALDARIWTELVESTRRRQLDLALA
jgi:hypothetical protein